MQNLSQNECNQIAVMRGLSPDELEQFAKIRKIKKYEDMKKEDLIVWLLKSKESIVEFFNDNRHNNEISDIRRIINRLRDIRRKRDRMEIEDKLYKIEHQRNISEEEEKKRNDEYLRELVRILNNKEKHGSYDHNHYDYHGIADIPILFGETIKEDYYKPIFVNSSHKGNYKHYESNGNIEKKLSVYQYLNKLDRIYMIKGLKKIRREYQILSYIVISITGKIKNFHQIKKTGKSLNKIIKKLH